MAPRRKLPSLRHAREIMEPCEYIVDVYKRRYGWVVTEFIPAVRRLAASPHQKDRWLAAEGYYLIGDVYDFNDAPRAAIRAYRKCLQLDPEEVAAWREIAIMQDRIGEYRKAKRAATRAWEIDPDFFGVDDPSDYDEFIQRNDPPLYRKGDLFWEASEVLAKFQPKKCLTLLEGKRSVQARQWRARAYGALGDSQSVIRQWQAISKLKGLVHTHSPDWFFLPDEVWEDPTFWSLMLKIAQSDRLAPDAYFNYHESLWDIEPPLSHQGKGILYFEYHLARTRRDHKAIASLSAKYPTWKEAAELMRHLASSAPATISGTNVKES